jgi:hypothetical protein
MLSTATIRSARRSRNDPKGRPSRAASVIPKTVNDPVDSAADRSHDGQIVQAAHIGSSAPVAAIATPQAPPGDS